MLDIGCGAGIPSREIAQAFPNAQCWGLDFSQSVVDTASNMAREAGLGDRCVFRQYDLKHLHEDASLASQFDWVTAFDAIHDQGFPDVVLKGRHLL